MGKFIRTKYEIRGGFSIPAVFKLMLEMSDICVGKSECSELKYQSNQGNSVQCGI